MSRHPHSRAIAAGYESKLAALVGLGIELQSVAAHTEVSDSTFRRARSGQPVVRAVARSIELAVDHLTARPIPTPAAPAP